MDRVARSLLPDGGRRPLTPEEEDSVTDVLDAAAAWKAGTLPLTAAAAIGTITYRDHISPRYSRFVAIATTPVGDPRRAALLEMVELMVSKMHMVTRFGVISRLEEHEHDQAIAALRMHERRAA